MDKSGWSKVVSLGSWSLNRNFSDRKSLVFLDKSMLLYTYTCIIQLQLKKISTCLKYIHNNKKMTKYIHNH